MGRAPSREAMARLVAYAQLVEKTGAERLAAGVDVALLPASKAELRESLARASRSLWSRLVLRPRDLAKLYGSLAFFFEAEALTDLARARAIEKRLAAGEEVSVEDYGTYRRGLELLSAAVGSAAEAERDLKAHAQRLAG